MSTSPFLFEVSWEVCNKVGGIHTVITSKLGQALKQFPEHYLAVGPYLSNSNSEFQERALPPQLVTIATTLSDRGVQLHYGTWLVDEEAPVILLGWDGLVNQLNDFKARWWEQYHLDSLGTDFYDIDQPVLWSLAAGMLIEEFAKQNPGQILAHGHEWLSAGMFLYLGNASKQIKTVFTTHATVLGRALSSHNVFIYDKFDSTNADEEAARYGVTTKHQLEKLSATLASCFTTVSSITSQEAESYLGRKAEVTVENGINLEEFPLYNDLCVQHTIMREKLHDFVSAYFFPSYRFDLATTSYQFTMGRYEVHNKGYDLYIEALGSLNRELQEQKSEKTIISFILVPGDSLQLRPDVAAQIRIYNRITSELHQVISRSHREIYASIWQDEAHATPKLSAKLQTEFNHLLSRLPQIPQPYTSPYQLRQGDNDEIVKLSAQAGLQNRKEDRVKLIFLPIYLDGFDGIFNIPLYDLLPGFDLGVFPSLYEPWGYTPLESLCLGVPAITSNLAGFGKSLQETLPNNTGNFVLERKEHYSSENLLAFLRQSHQESPRQADLRSMDAYLAAQSYSWDILYKNYEKAYQLAGKA